LGVSALIHRKVIVSMVQRVLIGNYDMGRTKGPSRLKAEDMLVPTELAMSFPLKSNSSLGLPNSGKSGYVATIVPPIPVMEVSIDKRFGGEELIRAEHDIGWT
ncbi:MAG: hypothetical protein ACK559_25085, partial [bacterium]